MKNASFDLPRNWPSRLAIFIAGVLVIAFVYVFQRVSFAALFALDWDANEIFIVNRAARLIFNDLGCFLIILAIFQEKKYLQVAFVIFLLELFVILPAYFVVKLSLEGDSELSSPFLSQIHRLIVNPVLMILLMAGFIFQRISGR